MRKITNLLLLITVTLSILTGCSSYEKDTAKDRYPENKTEIVNSMNEDKENIKGETSELQETTSKAKYSKDEIHKAANKGDIEKVKEILKTNPDVDARDSFGGTALHAAMFQDNIEIVKLLVENKFDVNAQGSSNGYTPLHDAVWANNLEAAKILVENGANLKIKAKDGLTPVEKAKKDGKEDMFQYLQNNLDNN